MAARRVINIKGTYSPNIDCKYHSVTALLSFSYLCKKRGVFAGVAKGVNVPGDPGPTADPKGLVQKPQADGHLVDDGAVVRRGLVAHTPATIYKLQPTWRSKSWVRMSFHTPAVDANTQHRAVYLG